MSKTQMKKTLGTAILVTCLLGSGNANATGVPVVDALNDAFNIAFKAAEDAWKTSKDAWDKSVWAKQAADMVESLKKLQTNIDKVIEAKDTLTSQITGITNVATNFVTNWSSLSAAPNKKTYDYAPWQPDAYIGKATCAEGVDCIISGFAYKGPNLIQSSVNLRDALKVDPKTVGAVTVLGITVGKNISQMSRETEEENAQSVAVIDAMAREAYVQAQLRLTSLHDLQDKVDQQLTLKQQADWASTIQSEQALLMNDQNRLAALAVLQQSQRDMYEQRKKEIAEYVKSGDRNTGVQILPRAVILAATTAAYAALDASY